MSSKKGISKPTIFHKKPMEETMKKEPKMPKAAPKGAPKGMPMKGMKGGGKKG